MAELLTKAEMVERYGSIPPLATPGTRFTWTINRAHASVTWISDDGGETWEKRGVVWAAERERRDEEALEMARIQRELK